MPFSVRKIENYFCKYLDIRLEMSGIEKFGNPKSDPNQPRTGWFGSDWVTIFSVRAGQVRFELGNRLTRLKMGCSYFFIYPILYWPDPKNSPEKKIKRFFNRNKISRYGSEFSTLDPKYFRIRIVKFSVGYCNFLQNFLKYQKFTILKFFKRRDLCNGVQIFSGEKRKPI